ncbi:MAG: hypothetical protein HKN25_04085, partial [Pyrinomonadaceae bacterium]|nr:hypothetical protein [Pyrinomonadaceae bacterium]
MKCTEVKEKLESFFDGETRSSENDGINSHLVNCDTCRADLESLKRIRKTMKRVLPISAPASLDSKVLGAFHTRQFKNQTTSGIVEQKKTGWFGIPKLAFAGALLLLVLFSALAFQAGRISAGNVQASAPNTIEKSVQDAAPAVPEISGNEGAKAIETK